MINSATPTLRPIPRSIRGRQVRRHEREFLHVVGVAPGRERCAARGKGSAAVVPGREVQIRQRVAHGEALDGADGEVFGLRAGCGDGGGGVGD